MSENSTSDAVREWPAYREWSVAVVRLLQGVVYKEDEKAWNLLLRHPGRIEDYFATIGLRLVIHETDGFAYLRQFDADDDGELPEEYENLPPLFRRSRLTYEATLLCVLVRDELRRFEEEEVSDERCVTSVDELFEQWKAFFPADRDEVRLRRTLDTALRKLEELKYIRRFGKESDQWEVRRIMKARVPAAALEKLKADLARAAGVAAGSEEPSDE